MIEEKSEEIVAEVAISSKNVSNIPESDAEKMEMPKPEIVEEGFSVEESFKVGWEIFKDNIGMMILAVIIIFGLQIVSEIISQVFINVGQNSLSMVISLVSAIAQIIIEIGVVNIFLRAYDKKEIRIGDLFSRTDRVWVFIGAGIIMNFIIMGGGILFLVPGVVAMVALSPVTILAVDRKMGAMEVIRTSWEITQNNKGNLFVFMIVAIIFNFLGLIALGVGLLVTSPVTFLAMVHIYRKLFAQAERRNKIPVEKLRTAPKIFLWIGIIVIPLLMLIGIVLIAVGTAMGGV